MRRQGAGAVLLHGVHDAVSLMTDEGFVTVHECDTIVLDDDGRFHVEK